MPKFAIAALAAAFAIGASADPFVGTDVEGNLHVNAS